MGCDNLQMFTAPRVGAGGLPGLPGEQARRLPRRRGDSPPSGNHLATFLEGGLDPGDDVPVGVGRSKASLYPPDS